MPYWMTNAEHGVMPVYDTGAVEQAKVHGWTLLNEGESPEFPKEPEEEPKRKPGRPRKAE